MKPDKYVIREYKDSDRKEIRRLYQSLFQKTAQDFEKLWQWQFTINPNVKNVPPVRIVLELDSEVIGFIGGFPLQLKLADKDVAVFSGAIFMVNRKFPGRGISIAKEYLTSSDFRITLSAGERTAKIFQALGAVTISQNRFVALKCYSTKKILKEYVKTNKFTKILDKELILNCFSKLSDVFLKVFNCLFSPVSKGLQIKEIRHLGDDFESFWKIVSKEYTNIFVRNKEYLKWRLFQAPFETPKVFAAYDKNNQLKGYIAAVCTVKKSVRCGKIIDYLAHKNDEETIASLVSFTLKCLKQEGAELVYSEFYTDKFKKAFLKNGFLLFKRKRPNPIWLKDNTGLTRPDSLQNSHNWFYTGSEGDGFVAI